MSKQHLTDEQLRELAALAAMPDETIDTDDIPELSEEKWFRATRGCRPNSFHETQTEPTNDIEVRVVRR